MAGAGIGDHAHRLPANGESQMEFATLISGNRNVGGAVQNQQRCGYVCSVHHGRELQEGRGVHP